MGSSGTDRPGRPLSSDTDRCSSSCTVRLRITHAIYSANLVRHGVSSHVEPTPAAERMKPAFVVDSLGILAVEEIRSPFSVAHIARWARNVRLPAEGELGLIAQSAKGTGNS